MIYFQIFFEFFKIGLFSFGGGYATLPFLYHVSKAYGWFTGAELSKMLAISSVTPGAIGLNVATFAGFKTAGVFGSIVATLAIMLPSFFLVVIISKILKKFKNNFYLEAALYALRPATAAMLAAVGFRLIKESLFIGNSLAAQGFAGGFGSFFAGMTLDFKGFLLLCALFVLSFKTKKNPVLYLGLGAIAGIILNFGT